MASRKASRKTPALPPALAELAKAAKRAKAEKLERALAFHIAAAKLPKPTRQHRFHPSRLWRFDFAWPSHKFAVEVDGGIWIHGGHSRGSGQLADMEKQAEAVILGWRLIRVADRHLRTGQAIDWITRGLAS